jgi:hypothetical protein
VIREILEEFDQDDLNRHIFGNNSKQGDAGTCLCWSITWLAIVRAFPDPTKEAAHKRKEYLLISRESIKTLDAMYAQKAKGLSLAGGSVLTKDQQIFNAICEAKNARLVAPLDKESSQDYVAIPKLAECSRQVDPKTQNILEIPTTESQKFNQIVDHILSPGSKIVKMMFGGGANQPEARHAAAAIGLGDRILYFDPNDGEILFDRSGFNMYCVTHWMVYKSYCMICFFKVAG